MYLLKYFLILNVKKIGAGIGLASHRPDVGGAIGMGIGFLLMAFLRNKKITPITISLPKNCFTHYWHTYYILM
jgi:hypothetical protein